jgi:hypothetical protein
MSTPNAPSVRQQPAESRDRGIAGEQHLYRFANGFGASVIRGPYSYGGPGLYELAVLGRDGQLTYETPVTGDVEGWLDEDRLQQLLDQVEALPEAPQ